MRSKNKIKSKLCIKTDTFMHRHFSGDTLDYHQIISIYMPLLVDMAFLQIMNFLNVAMISSSGQAAIAAVSMVDSVNNFLVSIFASISVGGTVIVAQYTGKKDQKNISKAIAATVTTVVGIAFMISILLLIFRDPALGVLGGKAELAVMENAKIYIFSVGLSYCGVAIRESICGSLRGIGETRSSLFLSVIMNASYVILNLVFIKHLKMGIVGMGLSLNISRYLSAICSLLLIFKRKNPLFESIKHFFSFEKSMIKRVVRIGVPFASEQLFFNGGKILTQTFIVRLGSEAMQINAICASINGLSTFPQNALVPAVVTVVGQCLGRKDVKQAKKVIRSFICTGVVAAMIMMAIILGAFPFIASFFSEPGKALPISEIWKISVFAELGLVLFWNFGFIVPAALRAGGDSRYTSRLAMLSMWLFRVILGYVLGIWFSFGIMGVWISMILEWGVRGYFFYQRFKSDKWYQHKVIV